MILDDKTKAKPNIEYPCEWGFKLIGRDKKKLQECVSNIMRDKNYKCRDGNISKNGKFVSFNTSCIVSSKEERDRIFKAFQEHNDIKMVI